MARVRLANRAAEDLRDIRIYSKQVFGASVARKYMDGLKRTFATLADQPKAGASESDLGSGLRGISYRSHRLFYRVNDGDVLIIRILHYARDAARQFEED